jgi:hypothetical protein
MLLEINQPHDCFIVATIMFAISSIHFAVIIFWPQLLRRFRISWGRFGGSVPVSRLGDASWGVAFAIFGLASTLAGFGKISNAQVPIFLIAGFLVIVTAGFYDIYHHKRKK